MDADTLPFIRGVLLPNVHPFDSEGFHKVDKALYGYRGSPRFWKDTVAEATTAFWTQNRQLSLR